VLYALVFRAAPAAADLVVVDPAPAVHIVANNAAARIPLRGLNGCPGKHLAPPRGSPKQ